MTALPVPSVEAGSVLRGNFDYLKLENVLYWRTLSGGRAAGKFVRLPKDAYTPNFIGLLKQISSHYRGYMYGHEWMSLNNRAKDDYGIDNFPMHNDERALVPSNTERYLAIAGVFNALDHEIALARGWTIALETTRTRLQRAKADRLDNCSSRRL
ncbi:uncharacterized protein ATNIH1004_005399 [Aspergillus tanneri]|uniref:Uncharacterized protein n=1 Tax=Aspergillus tanneri TaxID=1220188 RepID=A0A5M9MMR9_9EURO|nr:uncharacterized protein ATNIH1004_005399 [Aspergillus tanneri]KAA8646724.1 hypothetical protein ATNIH1004_005399 [Aspergillus tanneri]